MIVAVLHRSSSFFFGFATLMNLHTGENSQTRSDLNILQTENRFSNQGNNTVLLSLVSKLWFQYAFHP